MHADGVTKRRDSSVMIFDSFLSLFSSRNAARVPILEILDSHSLFVDSVFFVIVICVEKQLLADEVFDIRFCVA